VAVIADAPAAAYVAAVFAATAVTSTRPAQATLIPSLAVTAHQLTAANVVAGWLESVSIAASGLLTGILLAVGGVAVVFGVCAGLGVAAMVLVARLRVRSLGSPPEHPPKVLGDLRDSLRLTARQPRVRLMVGLLTADAIVVGALDLLVVILAISVLGRPQAWAGYLNFALGAGAVLAATVSVTLVGRGDGVGEIALLRDVPRTATVTAHTAATVYQLNRQPFLSAVLGHAPTHRQASRIADARLATGPGPGASGPPGQATMGPG
jgi:hypothetical protein